MAHRLIVLKTISDKIHLISRGWTAFLSLLIMVLFMLFVLPNQSEKSLEDTGSSQSPDTSFFYTPEELYQIADEYGQDGRQAYIRARWTFDLAFPLVYVAFLTIGISWFYRFLTSWKDFWKFGNIFPILGGVFDYLENGAASWLMYIYPSRLAGLAQLTVIFTITKWILITISFLVYFTFGIGSFYAWLRQRRFH